MGKQTRSRSCSNIYSDSDTASENEHDTSVIECAQRSTPFTMAPSKLATTREWDTSLLNTTATSTMSSNIITTTSNALTAGMTVAVENSMEKWRQLKSETVSNLSIPDDTIIAEHIDENCEELLDMMYTKLSTHHIPASAASATESPTTKSISTPPQKNETFPTSAGIPQNHETPYIPRQRSSPQYSHINNTNDEYIKLLATVITGQQEMIKNMMSQNHQLQEQLQHNMHHKQQELEKLLYGQHQQQVHQKGEFEDQLQKQKQYFQEQMKNQKQQAAQQLQEQKQISEEQLQKQQHYYQQNIQVAQNHPKQQQLQNQQQLQHQRSTATSLLSEPPVVATISPTTETGTGSQETAPTESSSTNSAPAPRDQSEKAQSSQSKPKERKHAVIYGDSIVNHVNTFEMAKNYKHTITRVCCYKGAETGEIAEHAQVDMKKRRVPHTAILHCGTNDLHHKVPIQNIVNETSMAATLLQTRGVKNIAISSVTPRFGLKDKITKLNNELQKLCREMNLNFINHTDIKYNIHISDWDYTHLNHQGVKKLQTNFASYIKSCEMKE